MSHNALKKALKEALIEILHEERDLFREVLIEAMDDLVLNESMREDHDSKQLNHDDFFPPVEGLA